MLVLRRVTTVTSLLPHPPNPLRLILHLTAIAGPSPDAQQPSPLHQTLRDHGFADPHIADLVQRAPWLLSYRSVPLLASRLRYLSDHLELPPADLVKLVTSDPGVLRGSLDGTLAPSLAFLLSFYTSPARAARAVFRFPWLLRSAHPSVASNVAVMRSSGVPDSSIARLLYLQPRALFHTPASFRQILDAVLLAGFAPSEKMFVHAFRYKASRSGPTWERKIQVYLAFGWSREEAQAAFRRCPCALSYSEEKMTKQLDFLTNVLKIGAAELLPYMKLMGFSLERTLIPRCCVLDLLMRKGLVKKERNFLGPLCTSHASFVEKFVDKYKAVAPQVLEAYEGKMKFSGFDRS